MVHAGKEITYLHTYIYIQYQQCHKVEITFSYNSKNRIEGREEKNKTQQT